MVNLHSILSLGAVDGGGNRTVIFLQGCNLACQYCHNPDSRSMMRKNVVTVDDVFKRSMRFKAYWGRDGGITISGGEPLIQAAAVLELIERFKREGVHTAVDTSGGVRNETCDLVFKTADLILLDIKHTDSDAYYRLTGGKLQLVLDNLATIKRLGTPFIVRQVIVEGINDTVEQVKKLKELAFGSKKIELLPYHTMGIEKWRELNIPYPLEGVPPTSEERIEMLLREMEQA